MVGLSGFTSALGSFSDTAAQKTPQPEKTFKKALAGAERTLQTEAARDVKPQGGIVPDSSIDDTRPIALLDKVSGTATLSDVAEPSDSRAAGEQAAKEFNEWYDTLTPREQAIHGVFRFGDSLGAHADDPEWQAGFLDALGDERVSELVDQATDPGSYLGTNVGAQERANLDAIGDALGVAYENGSLSDASIRRMISSWMDANGGEIPPQIAKLFADSSSAELKEAFVDQALDTWRTGGGDNESVAAAAAYVLDHTNTRIEIETLIELEDSGELEGFIRDAMAGAHTPSTTFSSAANTDPDHLEYDGVTGLIRTVGTREYSGGTVTSLPADPADVERVALTLFDASNDGLRESTYYQNTPEFKDALTNLFTANFDQLVANSIENNGSISADFGHDLETFSQHVLFGSPAGERQEFGASFLAGKLADWKELAEGGQPTDRVDIGDTTRSRSSVANLTGQVLAHSLNGLQFAIEDEEARVEDNVAARNFLIDVAFDLLPGPDGRAGDVVDAIFGAGKGETKGAVKAALDGDDIDIDAQGFNAFYDEIRNSIGADNPEATAENLREAFEDGFTGVRPVDVDRPTN